jgi:hypothetical protein
LPRDRRTRTRTGTSPKEQPLEGGCSGQALHSLLFSLERVVPDVSARARLYSMNPSFLNLFMNPLIRGRVGQMQ